MENQKNDNLNLLEAVVQNTEMGKNTLEQIVPMTDDTQFKAELLRQRNLYHQLNQEAHTAMEACGGTAQGQSAMAKFNTKMGISMKTLTDKSTRNLAEMLTQGSGMGVVDCVKAQKDYPNAAPGTKRLAQRLMEFEEDNRVLPTSALTPALAQAFSAAVISSGSPVYSFRKGGFWQIISSWASWYSTVWPMTTSPMPIFEVMLPAMPEKMIFSAPNLVMSTWVVAAALALPMPAQHTTTCLPASVPLWYSTPP